ncbi:hypothetical protein JD969_17730 [Planctomycetota bacterium]|nr:hypothetical protein JD969_17730 [Planctomycetota bacterium]
MKKQIANMVIIGVTSFGALMFVPRVQAQSPVIDPINLTQNIVLVTQKIEELVKIGQQIKMYEEQIKSWSFSDVFNTLKRMGSLGDQIDFNSERLDGVLDALPDEWKSVDLEELKKFREDRLEANRERTKELLKTQEIVADNASKVKGQIEGYVGKSNGASGALSAIQAGNEMLATTISQIQDMQALEIANLQMEIEKTAEKQSKEAWDQAYGKVNAESQDMLTGEK